MPLGILDVRHLFELQQPVEGAPSFPLATVCSFAMRPKLIFPYLVLKPTTSSRKCSGPGALARWLGVCWVVSEWTPALFCNPPHWLDSIAMDRSYLESLSLCPRLVQQAGRLKKR